MNADPASFRDPAGQVHEVSGRIFRSVEPAGFEDYAFIRDSGALAPLVAEGLVIDTKEVNTETLNEHAPTSKVILEHPRLPFWSYPYEWPFEALKTAALAHLDIQSRLLARGVSLSDASAYNVQFQGARPVFIDSLSFRRYRKNEHWRGYRQFCEQFLNPLLLQAVFGLPFQDTYRGSPDGIPTAYVARLATWRHHLSPSMLAHVIAPARLQAQAANKLLDKAVRAQSRGLPTSSYHALLTHLRSWIARLRPRHVHNTPWGTYADSPPGGESSTRTKQEIVADFAASVQPSLAIDLGCNTGVHAACMLKNGTTRVVGLDHDAGALEQAFARARGESLNFLPLYQNCANPSPGQGWDTRELRSLNDRCREADAVIALAFEHHLVIGHNIPLARAVCWITSLAPQGLIEFVPKEDPTIQTMLALRSDVFDDYNVAAFTSTLERQARIVRRHPVSETGRVIFQFERQKPL